MVDVIKKTKEDGNHPVFYHNIYHLIYCIILFLSFQMSFIVSFLSSLDKKIPMSVQNDKVHLSTSAGPWLNPVPLP